MAKKGLKEWPEIITVITTIRNTLPSGPLISEFFIKTRKPALS